MLQIAFFPEFSDNDYVVFWGSKNDIVELRDTFVDFCKTKATRRFSSRDGELVLSFAPASLGMRRVGEFGLSWTLEADHAAEFCAKLEQIVEADHPCHNYLECNVAGEIPVLVSRDAYSPDMK